MKHEGVAIRLTVLWGCLMLSSTAGAQSLFLDRGQRAVDATVGWSVGPSSDGIETAVGVALDGRLDLGFAFNRYDVDLGDGSSSTFNEYAPFVRYFAVKEGADGAPVSLALHGQYFGDDYSGDDTGWYVMTGMTLAKRLRLSKPLTIYPFGGFSFVGESYSFGGGPSERAVYLTRNLGLHLTIPLAADGATVLRATVEEQSFRRETYRTARIGVVRRF
jgi:hypothetical protein